MKDLRSFLRELTDNYPDEIVRVTREVSPVHELSAIVKLFEARGNPVIHFERVTGSQLPVVAGVCATRRRIARALGQSVESAVDHLVTCSKQPVEPDVVTTGPVKDIRHLGQAVDLAQLPICVHVPKQGGPYITAGIGLVRNPETGTLNMGIYRMMVKTRNRLTITTSLGHHLGQAIHRGWESNQPVEFAIVIGHHPALAIASQAKSSLSEDSIALAGALLKEPVAMTPAETVDLNVPAYAEVVMEGRILPNELDEEGPFGEFTYYYEGERNAYVCEITAITHRTDACYVDLHPTHSEHRNLWLFPGREAWLRESLREVLPNTTAVHIPSEGAGMHAYIAIAKQHDADGVRALTVTLGLDSYIKHATVVDSDIDIFDRGEILWATAVRFQADRDMILLPNSSGISTDPSAYSLSSRYSPSGELTTKIGFDATFPVGSLGSPILERADILPANTRDIDLNEYVHSSP